MLANISILFSLLLFLYGINIFARQEIRLKKENKNTEKTKARKFSGTPKNK
jgi:hypothetical protein